METENLNHELEAIGYVTAVVLVETTSAPCLELSIKTETGRLPMVIIVKSLPVQVRNVVWTDQDRRLYLTRDFESDDVTELEVLASR